MTPKEKAQNLVEKYKPYVYPYIGSSYLTGDEFPEEILRNAKICALITVDEIISDQNGNDTDIGNKAWWWNEVKQEIEKL